MNKDIELIKALRPCSEGLSWAKTQPSLEAIYDNCHRCDWLLWLLGKTGKITKKQSVGLAIAMTERVLHIFEQKYPNSKRPRQAIEAAKAWLANPTEGNRLAAEAAAEAAARAAARAAATTVEAAARAAAWAAARAAEAAATTVEAAARAAEAAARAAEAAARAAARAARAAAWAAVVEAAEAARAAEQLAQADLVRSMIKNPWRSK